MISTLKRKINTALLCLLLGCTLVFPALSFAQAPNNAISLSVTPTLFEMSASPSQVWESSVKVINNNPQELTVYASVVNFAPQGETGEGKFLPVFSEETNGATLAEWITVPEEAMVIPPEQSYSIPLKVQVPADAAPGGHFAAILIGTRPVDREEAFQVRTSQLVTSLFFVRVAGDVEENGVIREFRTTKTFVNSPEANFEVRFENKGNVHLQPQGEIKITNMWGKERGMIPINHKTHFGNVLPESIRKFEFTWKGESSISDIGRYKAALTLAYGDGDRKFVTSTAYFYVVPLKALSIVLGSLLLFGFLISWMIKAYIRRMLALAGVEPSAYGAERRSFVREGDVRIVKRQVSLKAPVENGMLDFKKRLAAASALKERFAAVFGFIVSYKIFFGSLLVLLIAGVLGFQFLSEVTTEQKDYEVVIDNADTEVTLSSEEIIYEREQEKTVQSQDQEGGAPQIEQAYTLVLVNSSDIPGAAASLQARLEKDGYTVDDLRSDFEESKERTVIIYDVAVQEGALELSKKLGNAPISAIPSSETNTPSITIYIGNDYTTF